MFNPFRLKPHILIFVCQFCDAQFAKHRKDCRWVPGLGGDRYCCKCPVCGAECKVGEKWKN